MLLLLTAVLIVSARTLDRSRERKLQDTESSAVNLSVSQARRAEDTFLQTEITLRAIQREIPDSGPNNANKAELNAVLVEMKSSLPQLNGLLFMMRKATGSPRRRRIFPLAPTTATVNILSIIARIDTAVPTSVMLSAAAPPAIW